MRIRQEEKEDHKYIFIVHNEAFGGGEEADLVERLRKCGDYVPDLSLVAEDEGKVVGHLMLTTCKVIGEPGEWDSLVLAPVGVSPKFQGQGVGGALIREGLKRAAALGFESVNVLGEASYYPRFGFSKASDWGVECPLEVPDECFMMIELKEGALAGKSGMVRYPMPFMI